VASVNDLSRYPRIPEHLLANARVVADRWQGMMLWPKEAVVVEVGVALGDFSKSILQHRQPARFIAIDRFDLHELTTLWGRPTKELFSGGTHLDFYRARFAEQIAAGTFEVIQGDSAPSIAALPDESVDVFYVDADHLYDGVRKDLAALRTKVKPDGWIIMNDYLAEDTFGREPLGVIQATNEFMVEHGWEMVYFALAPIMYCDVGLRKLGEAAPDWSKAAPDIPARLAASESRLIQTQQRAAELEKSLAEIQASRSWRITAPLRALSGQVFRRR
jgi:hypothetical protein